MSAPTAAEAPAQAESVRVPSLWVRAAAMIYEGVLLFGVLFAVSFVVLASLGWQHPLNGGRRAALFAIWVATLGAYFVWQWTHGGRTLAMKAWDLVVTGPGGAALTPGQALARYLLAWHLFLPAIAFIALAAPGGAAALAALAASPLLTLLLCRLDPQRQMLHDRLLGTRVMQHLLRPAR